MVQKQGGLLVVPIFDAPVPAELDSSVATPHQCARAESNGRPFSRTASRAATGAPCTSSAKDIEDGIDKFTHVHAARTTTRFWQGNQRFKDSPLLVGQVTRVSFSVHNSCRFVAMESNLLLLRHPLNRYEFGLRI